MTAAVNTANIDYLQRFGAAPDLSTGSTVAGPESARRLLRIAGIGRTEKYSRAAEVPPTAQLLTGLYGHRIPVAFAVRGKPDGVQVTLGAWSLRESQPGNDDRRRDVALSVLRSLYPVVDAEMATWIGGDWPLSGYVLGTPAPMAHEQSSVDAAAPWDRIIRSMSGADYCALVLAYPVGEHALADQRQGVLNEIRSVSTAGKLEGSPSPLLETYDGLLRRQLASLSEALATGGWRTAVYLLGDGDSYPRLAAAWRSVFSGPESLPEPVRVFDAPQAGELARTWAYAEPTEQAGAGLYRRPFEAQTLLTSAQLAQYVHLPETETPGFSVDTAPRFDSVRPSALDRDGIALGAVLHNKKATGTDYRLTLDALTRHVLVAGLTGSGKTNTIFSLLSAADDVNVPFLVIEPAKTEYRALLRHPHLGPRVRAFTAGRDTVSPLLINPFEVPDGVTVSEHLDLLRAAFAASFGMWTPLPQILERCLHQIYVDRGWDLRTNINTRIGSGATTADAWPRLTDLIVKVNDVIPSLGYEDRVAGDLRAALVTRLEALRAGGKGSMFDVGLSMPIEDLLAAPAVIELEAMGDDGDKAFLTALLLIRLVEYRRAAGQRPSLQHLLVIEEAHWLLANVGRMTEGYADPRGQAVEVFSNLLSEIRAYGQGVIIADQVPVRLAPDVVKNTDLKIAHRIVANDDRFALAGAMAMDEEQARALTTLAVGEAAVFSSGDDTPVLVRIPLAKDPLSPVPPTHTEVAERMAAWSAAARSTGLFWPIPSCAQTCADDPAACAAARRLAEDTYVQRILARTLLSTATDPSALDRLWEDLVNTLNARREPGITEHALLQAFAGHGADWFARHRGVQGGWTFIDTDAYTAAVRDVLLGKLHGSDATDPSRVVFTALAARLHRRDFDPYPVCSTVCGSEGECRYRSAVADLVTSGRYRRTWRDADATDAKAGAGQKATWEVCQDAAYELIEFPDEVTPPELLPVILKSARQACMCFEQQMLAEDYRKVPRTVRRILARTFTEAGME